MEKSVSYIFLYIYIYELNFPWRWFNGSGKTCTPSVSHIHGNFTGFFFYRPTKLSHSCLAGWLTKTPSFEVERCQSNDMMISDPKRSKKSEFQSTKPQRIRFVVPSKQRVVASASTSCTRKKSFWTILFPIHHCNRNNLETFFHKPPTSQIEGAAVDKRSSSWPKQLEESWRVSFLFNLNMTNSTVGQHCSPPFSHFSKS